MWCTPSFPHKKKHSDDMYDLIEDLFTMKLKDLVNLIRLYNNYEIDQYQLFNFLIFLKIYLSYE